MEKITKSTDTVLIDPNEPLILPDGTALVGRIEWFLYALCCLDYQNLPTPMSRIEEFANALITGEIPNIEPQSRAEQFFLAILDGNVSNLPQPQSRSEVLLDKLARGEFDLSDVEPIQSRYELLLAYLIKNGGIGNIDYVLYEFSEAMKTMYNTVEKPFKSLELSGNTLVNCVLEDTENDDYTSFDKDYSGTSFTINGTSEGAIKSATLSGQTLVNIVNGHISLTDTNSIYCSFSNGDYVFQAKDSYEGRISPANMMYLNIIQPLKQNTTYTLIVEQISGGNSSFGLRVGYSSDDFSDISERQSYTGIHKVTFLTSSTKNVTTLSLRLGAYTDERSISFKNIMIIEGDHTQEDIPYFTGMQSIKMPVLTTTGKNLFDLELTQGTHGYGVTGIKPNFNGSNTRVTNLTGTYIKVNPNTKITFSILNNIDFAIAELDINGYSLGDTGWVGYATIKPNHTITTKEKTSYIGFNFRKFDNSNITVQEVLDSNPMLEISGTATTYEPYKSNILTTSSKNLFDMNRPYDTITDSQATVVQDTNQITVSSSAESGIYVNANFILDKDFFAGKTVTGSCLYESDEKDIGTVQIHYQDGNGDHHYQWIRTPKTFTFPNSFIGDVMLSVSANNTGTPQSNTVTVKNIQLELGSTATTYEPYLQGVTLRGIGDVKDDLNLITGELTQRITEIVLSGSEEWVLNRATINHILWQTAIANPALNTSVRKNNMLCNKLIVEDFAGFDAKDYEFISINNGKSNVIYLKLDKTKGSTLTELKNYLQSNPITVQYQLATESVKTVDLNVVDQDNTKIDKIHVFNETTHVNASSDELTPTVNIGKSVSYPTIIKPNTKYTVDLKRNDKPLTVNLGGTEVTFTNGETRKTITTPSTLTNDKLSYYGVGAKCNEIMLIEGEIERNIDYFTGMQSVVIQNQMPILCTIGKNLFNIKESTINWNGANIKSNNDNTITFTPNSSNQAGLNGVFEFVKPIRFKVGTQFTYSFERANGGNSDFQGAINARLRTKKKDGSYKTLTIGDFNSLYFDKAISKTYTFTEDLDSIVGVEPIMFTVKDLKTPITIQYQLEESSSATTYEPYKSSILSCNDDVTLRGIGEVKDTLDCLTGEVVKNTKEVVLNGSEEWVENGFGTMRYYCQKYTDGKSQSLKVLSDKIPTDSKATTLALMNLTTTGKIQLITNFSTVNELKEWLSQNPNTVQYELATPVIKTVDLNVVDQDGNTIPKIKSYDGVTHLEVTVPKQSLLPNISAEVATDNSKDMSSLTIKHQEISEAQSAIEDNIQSQSDEIDTALMATTEIFESILE